MPRSKWNGKLADLEPTPIKAQPKAAKPRDPSYCLSLDDAAAYLGGVGHATMERLVYDGQLPSLKVAGRRMLRRRDLEEFCDRQSESAYRLQLPKTIREVEIAVAALEREHATLTQYAAGADGEDREYLALAARAIAQLRLFYQWNAGLGDFAPAEKAARLSA